MNFKTIDQAIKFLRIPILFIFFSYLVLTACYNLQGSDYLFHLKAGQHIVAQKSVPQADVFSFTVEGKKWVDHEWLYQVFCYLIYDNLGISGLFLLKIIIFSLAFFILTAFIYKTDWILGFPLIYYGLLIAVRRFTLRPDNFSFLFLILFLVPFVFKKRKLLFLLPFIQFLWVNLHGFFFLGPVILGLYLLLGKVKNKNPDKKFYSTVKLIFIISLLTCFLNPAPLSFVSYPFKIITDTFSGHQGPFYEHILELKKPLSDMAKNYLFLGYLIFAGLCLAFYKRINLFYLGLALSFGLFASSSLRNMYFFIPVAIAIFVDRYPYIKELALKKVLRQGGLLLLKLLFVVFAVFVSINLFQKIENLPRRGQAYVVKDNKLEIRSLFLSRNPRTYPAEMMEFILQHELPARMFNNFNAGAPLIFNFFPQRKVFVDGRGDLYGPKFFALQADILSGNQKALDHILEKYQLQGFIITYLRGDPQPVIKSIKERGFKCVYLGRDGIIFVANTFLDKNPILRKKLINFKKVKMDKIDLLNNLKLNQPAMEGYFKQAFVLYLLGYPRRAEAYFKEILKISPAYAECHYLLARISYEQQEYQEAFRSCRKALLYRPNLESAKLLLAKVYVKNDNLEDARKILDKLKIDFAKFLKEVNSD